MNGAGQINGVRPVVEAPAAPATVNESAPVAASADAAPAEAPAGAATGGPAPVSGAGEPVPAAAEETPLLARPDADVLESGTPSLLTSGVDTLNLPLTLRTTPLLTSFDPVTGAGLLSANYSLEGTGAAFGGFPLLTDSSLVSPLQSYELLLLDWHPPMRLPERPGPFATVPNGGLTSPHNLFGPGSSNLGGFTVGRGPRLGVGFRSPGPRTGATPGLGVVGQPARTGPAGPTGDAPLTMEVSGAHARRELLDRQQSFYADLEAAPDDRGRHLDQLADEMVVEVITMASIGRGLWAAGAGELGVEITPENRREVSEAALALTPTVRVHDPDINRRYAIMAGLLDMQEQRLAELRNNGASEGEVLDAELKIEALRGRMEDTAPLLTDAEGQPIGYPTDVFGPPAPGQVWMSEVVAQTRVGPGGKAEIAGTEFGADVITEMMATPTAQLPDGRKDRAEAYARSARDIYSLAVQSQSTGYSSAARKIIEGRTYSAPVTAKIASPTNGSVLGREGAVALVADVGGIDADTAQTVDTRALEQALSDYMRARNGAGHNLELQAEYVERALDNLVRQVRFAVNRTLIRQDTVRTPVAETPMVGGDFLMA